MNPHEDGQKPLTNLHVSHSWGGGLAIWIEDFSNADPFSNNLIFESIGTASCYGIQFQLRRSFSRDILQSWTFQQPISEVTESHEEYRAVLATILETYKIDHIYVSSLIGHSLDLFRQGTDTTVVYHDYFPFCPAFYLTRDSQCASCNEDDLEACKTFPLGARPKNSPNYYLKFRETYFNLLQRSNLSHVAPSACLPINFRKIDSRFESISFHVIEHGIPLDHEDFFGGATDGRLLRIGVLGVLPWYKGAHELERCFPVARTIADFYFIGSHYWASSFVGRWGTKHVRRYDRAELPGIMADFQLDLALFYSIVPESFSYTRSEVQNMCIPPLARRIGAHESLVRDGVDGFLFGHEEEHFIDALLSLDRNRYRIRSVAAHLRRTPRRGVKQAVRDYYALRGIPAATTENGELLPTGRVGE